MIDVGFVPCEAVSIGGMRAEPVTVQYMGKLASALGDIVKGEATISEDDAVAIGHGGRNRFVHSCEIPMGELIDGEILVQRHRLPLPRLL